MTKGKLTVIIFLLLLSLFPLFWLKGDEIILHGASYIPLDTGDDLKKFSFTWDYQYVLGVPSKDFVKLPYVALFALGQWLGLSWIHVEKIVFLLWWGLSGFSMFYLANILVRGRDTIIPLIASLFYLLNLYVGVGLISLLIFTSYWLIPLVLALYIKFLEEEEGKLRNGIIFTLVSLLSAPVMANPPVYAVIFLPPGLYFLWYLFTSFRNRSLTPRKAFVALIPLFSVVLINLWWILPFISNILFGLGATGLSHQTVARGKVPIGLFSKTSSFLNLFRLFGHWALTEKHMGDLYYPFIQYYLRPALILVSYFLAAFSFFCLLTKKRDGKLLFFAFLFLFVLFVTKGLHPPLAAINLFCYKYLPFFWIFRNQWMKFVPLIIMSLGILLAFSTKELYTFLQKRGYRFLALFFVFLILVLILIQGYPLLKGEHINKRQKYLYSFRTVIPEYWPQAAAWLEAHSKDSRILLLPPNRFSAATFNYLWGYGGISLDIYLIHNSLIAADKKMGSSVQQNRSSTISNPLFFSFFREGRPPSRQLLELLNVGYILHRKDFGWKFRKIIANDAPHSIISTLKDTEGVKYEISFGPLDIYSYKGLEE
jgi:hypothetical protein